MADHSNRQKLITAFHNAQHRAALVLTGGGATAAVQLLAVPGGSRTILEIVVPYHEQALCEYLGRRPEQFCSLEAAVLMAERALNRARHLGETDRSPFGLGCTASLVTDRPKQGEHRFYVAAATEESTIIHWAVLQKGRRTREEEEAVVSTAILNLLAEVSGISERLAVNWLHGEQLHEERRPSQNSLLALIRGHESCICVEPDGRIRADAGKPGLLLPGAFNPLHEGHRQLLKVARKLPNLPAAFELSILNVDKAPLTIEEVRERMKQFDWLAPLWLTRAPTFVEKARLFPGVVFVVGVDTATRIAEPRYYGNSPEKMKAALAEIRSLECRFLVAARTEAGGHLLQLSDITLPTGFQELFTAIPASNFRMDISSTELRGKQA